MSGKFTFYTNAFVLCGYQWHKKYAWDGDVCARPFIHFFFFKCLQCYWNMHTVCDRPQQCNIIKGFKQSSYLFDVSPGKPQGSFPLCLATGRLRTWKWLGAVNLFIRLCRIQKKNKKRTFIRVSEIGYAYSILQPQPLVKGSKGW